MADGTETPGPEPQYDLTVKGPGVSIERKVPQAIALAVIGQIMRGEVGPTPPPGSGRVPAQTVGEFLSDVEAKRNPDKILAFGAYLMDEMGRQTFTRDEVRSMFQKAAEPVPGNFHRDFTWSVANRWLGEQAGTPGAFYVTQTGKKALANKFAPEVKAGSKLPRRRKPRKAGTRVAGNGGEGA